MENIKPTKEYCLTGKLAPREVYNQHIHLLGRSPEDRCPGLYLVEGKYYITTEGNELGKGQYLGKYIEKKYDGHSTGGAEHYYIFEYGKLYDNRVEGDLYKLNLEETEGRWLGLWGGKMRSRKARRKRRRTLKKHRKTKSRK